MDDADDHRHGCVPHAVQQRLRGARWWAHPWLSDVCAQASSAYGLHTTSRDRRYVGCVINTLKCSDERSASACTVKQHTARGAAPHHTGGPVTMKFGKTLQDAIEDMQPEFRDKVGSNRALAPTNAPPTKCRTPRHIREGARA